MSLVAIVLGLSALAAPEMRIFVTDAAGKPVDLASATAIVYLEPAGGKRQTLKPALVAAKGTEIPASNVQWRETPKHRVGVQFAKADERKPDAPHFAAENPAEAYACSMKDAPPQSAPGKCPKCGMEMELAPVEFDAVVVLRIDGETKSVRGFHHPPEVPPATYAAGVGAIEPVFADLERLVAAGKHDDAHPVADKLTRLGAATAATADAPKSAAIAAAAKSLGELAEKLDEAFHYGTPEEVKEVMGKYREAVKTMTGAGKN